MPKLGGYAEVREPEGIDAPIDGAQCLQLALDEIDYGVMLVSPGMRVLYRNRTARDMMAGDHSPVVCNDGFLRAASRDGSITLSLAIGAAVRKQRRSMVTLTHAKSSLPVAVVPLETEGDGVLALLMLGKPAICARLSADGYARAHGLTAAEAAVLGALVEGCAPSRIACMHGVALSTVRTQIGSIREKTGISSVRDLVMRLATLPPLVSMV